MLRGQVGPKLDDDVAAAGKGKGEAVVGHAECSQVAKAPRFRRATVLAPDSLRQ
jgi:hypothetical protein